MTRPGAKPPPGHSTHSQGQQDPTCINQASHHARLASYPTMDLKLIVQTIDEEIERLQRARSLLTGYKAPLKKRGRPRNGAPARKRGR